MLAVYPTAGSKLRPDPNAKTLMIPAKLKPGPRKSRAGWETMKVGHFRDGVSRGSLIGGFKNYFHKRRKTKARFTTRRINETTFRIYRTR